MYLLVISVIVWLAPDYPLVSKETVYGYKTEQHCINGAGGEIDRIRSDVAKLKVTAQDLEYSCTLVELPLKR